MNLINDLDTDIAFAFLIEKHHNEKINSKDVLSLIGRLNQMLEQTMEKEESAEQIVIGNKALRFGVC